jgi:hypothetical protein
MKWSIHSTSNTSLLNSQDGPFDKHSALITSPIHLAALVPPSFFGSSAVMKMAVFVIHFLFLPQQYAELLYPLNISYVSRRLLQRIRSVSLFLRECFAFLHQKIFVSLIFQSLPSAVCFLSR